jgi:hypothetical protein
LIDFVDLVRSMLHAPPITRLGRSLGSDVLIQIGEVWIEGEIGGKLADRHLTALHWSLSHWSKMLSHKAET